ncbi:MAG: DUF4416 family protein [Deltaproteobacteria bacterium]|nr:DUF4416 family protein [Deltaproteobacteria bacterium]
MGVIGKARPALRICSIMFGNKKSLAEGLEGLEDLVGPCNPLGPELPFDFTGYYEPEFGCNLKRMFFILPGLAEPDKLIDLKLATNRIEERLSLDGRRTVNIDPGNLELNRFSLATTKDAPHRLFLARGIYAELTLIFESGGFKPLPWTYPDYASEQVRSLLLVARKAYLELLKRDVR